jgi:hypothetical protein
MNIPQVIETIHTRGRMPEVGTTTVAWQGVIKRRIRCTSVAEYNGRTFAHWIIEA